MTVLRNSATSIDGQVAPLPQALRNAAIREVEVGREGTAVLRLVPTADDRVPIAGNRSHEALRERPTVSPKGPFVGIDSHVVDPAYAALVRIELDVCSVCG